jgi:hypothetical protein
MIKTCRNCKKAKGIPGNGIKLIDPGQGNYGVSYLSNWMYQ